MLNKPFSHLRSAGRPSLATIAISTSLFAMLLTTYVMVSKYVVFCPGAVFSRRREEAPSRHEMLSLFDPLLNTSRTKERLDHACTTHLPTRDDIEELRSRNWPPSRYLSYFNIDKLLVERWGNLDKATILPADKPRVLDAGGSSFLLPYKDVINISQTQYPGTDLHGTRYPPDSFDVVAADQLLEHANMPHIVMLEMHRILKKGGWAIVTTCATNAVHEVEGGFHDFWRFQLDGLRSLSMPFEGGIKMCGSWGTVKTLTDRLTGGMATINEKSALAEMEEELMKNDDENPLLVWLVVEK